ncbi:MAG: cupredoxin domain-containing protein [Pyrinomonadaceae bacterium]|nr:cupredoxin domain-containing protein [Pyrinomonadaceae bacterium]MBP6213483.1 cupredoxin domain-containing protein [Pyrinomonadaceae bacterium]
MKFNKRIELKSISKTVFVLSFGASLFFFTNFAAHAQTKSRTVKSGVQTARVLITDQGYSRTGITLRRGVLTRITFLRQTDATCATEVVIPAYGINRNLPLNEPVVISFTPKKSGEFGFTCGMNMMRGKLIVR